MRTLRPEPRVPDVGALAAKGTPHPMLDRLMGGSKLTDEQKRRVPPGQYVTDKFPVLHYGSVPRTDPATWDFKVFGERR